MVPVDKPSSRKISFNIDFIDAHHHFLNTKDNDFQSFLGSLLNGQSRDDAIYLPEQYYNDVVIPLRNEIGVNIVSSVHVECLPDDGYQEAQWIESLIASRHQYKNNNNNEQQVSEASQDMFCTVGAIVASCDLANPNVGQYLEKLFNDCPTVTGIRWILDYVGPYKVYEATPVATTRHSEYGTCDYLRYHDKEGQQPTLQGEKQESTIILPSFEYGYSLLEEYNYSFDLQCAPEQLPAAYQLICKYPNIQVVIDHLGKPMKLFGPDIENDNNLTLNEKELQCWRDGMELLSTLPNVCVKLSMLGWAVPGWIRSLQCGRTHDDTKETIVCPKIQLIQQLVYETIEMFTPKRCMVGTNYWKNDALSDSDGFSTVGPSPVEYIQFLLQMIQKKYNPDECYDLFIGTAKRFYRISLDTSSEQ